VEKARMRRLEEQLRGAEGVVGTLREENSRLRKVVEEGEMERGRVEKDREVERRRVERERERERGRVEEEREREQRRFQESVSRLQADLADARGVASRERAEGCVLHIELSSCEACWLAAETYREREGERVAEWVVRSEHEAVLREQLEGEKRRLEQTSASLQLLEEAVEQAEEAILDKQAIEMRLAQRRWRSDLAKFRSSRLACAGWRVLRAHVRLSAMRKRHEAQLHHLEEDRSEIEQLREVRRELEWRVTEGRAKLLVLGVGDESSAEVISDACDLSK
ncbi:MAG: hypothetical protein SGPRY_009241, partial [Prymnesium sp.]